jgi:predicted RNA-binding protein with RPS1 domain
VYDGKVAKITTFGAFVDVSPNISGLVHVSEMKDGFVKNPETIVKIGQMVKVKVLGRDDQGRLKLSMKGIS